MNYFNIFISKDVFVLLELNFNEFGIVNSFNRVISYNYFHSLSASNGFYLFLKTYLDVVCLSDDS